MRGMGAVGPEAKGVVGLRYGSAVFTSGLLISPTTQMLEQLWMVRPLKLLDEIYMAAVCTASSTKLLYMVRCPSKTSAVTLAATGWSAGRNFLRAAEHTASQAGKRGGNSRAAEAGRGVPGTHVLLHCVQSPVHVNAAR
jgi:hypothetical protein